MQQLIIMATLRTHLHYGEGKQQAYYIKPQAYDQWKKKQFKNDISKRENMFYDAEKSKPQMQDKKGETS